MPESVHLLQRTLDLLILKVLALSSLHGLGIAHRSDSWQLSVETKRRGRISLAIARALEAQ